MSADAGTSDRKHWLLSTTLATQSLQLCTVTGRYGRKKALLHGLIIREGNTECVILNGTGAQIQARVLRTFSTSQSALTDSPFLQTHRNSTNDVLRYTDFLSDSFEYGHEICSIRDHRGDIPKQSHSGIPSPQREVTDDRSF